MSAPSVASVTVHSTQHIHTRGLGGHPVRHSVMGSVVVRRDDIETLSFLTWCGLLIPTDACLYDDEVGSVYQLRCSDCHDKQDDLEAQCLAIVEKGAF